MTHASEYNMMNRYMLIENSSKLLKKELDDKKSQVEDNIKYKMKLLFEARTEYHNYFEEKNRLKVEERLLNEEIGKEETLRISHKSLTTLKSDKNSELRNQKKSLLDNN